MIIEQIAKVCHEVNRAYCSALEDFTQEPWESAEQWQRDSAINGVKFHLENPSASPSLSHDNWLKEKQELGWKWGPVKDADKKEHPCMCPYSQLPAYQKAKDFIFTAVVRELRSFL
jgi:hypothetical protein